MNFSFHYMPGLWCWSQTCCSRAASRRDVQLLWHCCSSHCSKYWSLGKLLLKYQKPFCDDLLLWRGKCDQRAFFLTIKRKDSNCPSTERDLRFIFDFKLFYALWKKMNNSIFSSEETTRERNGPVYVRLLILPQEQRLSQCSVPRQSKSFPQCCQLGPVLHQIYFQEIWR